MKTTNLSYGRIVESFIDYKGYTIRLRSITFGGFGYSIIKKVENQNSPDGIKKVYLREMRFNYIKAEDLLKRAKNYIDEFHIRLEEKFNKIKPQL